jgi:hypothetical protein
MVRVEEGEGEGGPAEQERGRSGAGDMRKRREEGIDDKVLADSGCDADAGAARDRDPTWAGAAQRGSEVGRTRAYAEEAAAVEGAHS